MHLSEIDTVLEEILNVISEARRKYRLNKKLKSKPKTIEIRTPQALPGARPSIKSGDLLAALTAKSKEKQSRKRYRQKKARLKKMKKESTS